MKILIVDDEPFTVEFLRMALEAFGFTNLESANSASEALAIVKKANDPFDCFLLDIQMPDMDGIALCQQLRTDPAYKRVPIVMLTAMSDRAHIERSFSAGATDYIVKPFQINDLMSRIDSAARLSRQIISADRLVRQIASACQGQATPLGLKFEDAISFDGTPGYLEQPTFRNYIERMERSQFRYGGVASVKLQNASDLFDCSTPQSFLGLLVEMSDVLSIALKFEDCHFTYGGSGCFLVVKLAPDKPKFQNEVEFLVKKELSRADLRYPESDNNPVNVSVGRVFRNASGEYGSIDETLARARKRVQRIYA
ncbi:response regulator [Loktanella sp. SALINAS62]|uniref:response regulator n=1 Tax=Loktanella sp. SALINAS62 TaxID=2706124 RepID=UPI001B8B3740|nr:response regulator [Loktanella sp. SALINAS62]MBS1302411.1 response regulator [Loktanella sp. SALINAS62]